MKNKVPGALYFLNDYGRAWESELLCISYGLGGKTDKGFTRNSITTISHDVSN